MRSERAAAMDAWTNMFLNIEEPDDLITCSQSSVALHDALYVPLQCIATLLDKVG